MPRSTKRSEVPEQFRDTGPTATEPQLSYLKGLRDGKDLSSLTPEQVAWIRDADFDTFPSELPKQRMSTVIEQLKELPWVPRDRSGDVVVFDVEDGRYAIEKTDGTLMFYSVKNGTHVTFVDVWASDARWPVKNRDEKKRILEAIKADPDAGPRFGREIGKCYVCGRTLTDEYSRSLGIGPVCRGDQ
jgi:hypothetical protein